MLETCQWSVLLTSVREDRPRQAFAFEKYFVAFEKSFVSSALINANASMPKLHPYTFEKKHTTSRPPPPPCCCSSLLFCSSIMLSWLSVNSECNQSEVSLKIHLTLIHSSHLVCLLVSPAHTQNKSSSVCVLLFTQTTASRFWHMLKSFWRKQRRAWTCRGLSSGTLVSKFSLQR